MTSYESMAGLFNEFRVRDFRISLSCAVVALGVTLSLQPFISHPFLELFWMAAVTSAWYGGLYPGLLTVLISTVLVDYFLIPPFYSFAINANQIVYFLGFVVLSIAASLVVSFGKRREQILEEDCIRLRALAIERATELQQTHAKLRENERHFSLLERFTRILHAVDRGRCAPIGDKGENRGAAEPAAATAQVKLPHLSRVLTIGELTACIAHEVSQPLTAVVTYGQSCLEWLSHTPPNLEEARRAARRAIEDGERAGAVVSRIRAACKSAPVARTWLNMNEVIHKVSSFLRNEGHSRGIQIRTELAPDLPKVVGDSVQLQQVVLNLAMNSLEAHCQVTGGAREVVIGSRKHSEKEILVVVTDSGVGISADIAKKLFKPFFTTKPKGMGIGLSISRSIIESHEGRLWAESRPEGGAIFQFTIPTGSKNLNRSSTVKGSSKVSLLSAREK